MDTVHSDILSQNRTYLLDNLELRRLMDYLLEDGVINVDGIEKIQAEQGRRDQARAFLNRLDKCGPDAFDYFIKALEKTQAFIAEKLNNDLRSQRYSYVDKTFNLENGQTCYLSS